jgi:hypothetical protein
MRDVACVVNRPDGVVVVTTRPLNRKNSAMISGEMLDLPFAPADFDMAFCPLQSLELLLECPGIWPVPRRHS